MKAVVMDALCKASREELESYLESRNILVYETDSTAALRSIVFIDIGERIDPNSPGYDCDYDDADDVVSVEVVDVLAVMPTSIIVVFADSRIRAVPKSAIHDESEVFDLDHCEGELLVSTRFALRHGWV